MEADVLNSEVIIKCIVSGIDFYNETSFIDFACSHFKYHYDCYTDIAVQYYYIYNNIYVVINPLFTTNNREFLEILFNDENNFLSVNASYVENIGRGSCISIIECNSDDKFNISYKCLETNEIILYSVKYLDGKILIVKNEEI